MTEPVAQDVWHTHVDNQMATVYNVVTDSGETIAINCAVKVVRITHVERQMEYVSCVV